MPAHESNPNTWSITFLFRMTGVETPIILGKLRTLSYAYDRPDLIVDSNGPQAPNYYGSSLYPVTEDGIWAFSISKQVMNFTGNGGFGGLTWAAFSDPASTKGTGTPVNTNENATFEWIGVYDGTLSYQVKYMGVDGKVLATKAGHYNSGIAWTNLITQVRTVDELYTGVTPTKPADDRYTYVFDGWVDADGNPLDAAVGEIVAYPSFIALRNPNRSTSWTPGANAIPLTGPVIMVGEDGFVPSYEAAPDTWSITFLIRMTGVENPLTMGKLRTLTTAYDLPNQPVDSNGSKAPNYYGTSLYPVSSDGVYAFTISKPVMNFTGNGGFGGVQWAAFSDPASTKGTGTPHNPNPDAMFELLGICDGTPTYEIVYINADNSYLDRKTGSYNAGISWSNLMTKMATAESLYTGALPGKPADDRYSYVFDGWVDADGKPIEMVVGTVMAFPSFYAVPKIG